jgi:hypothetical protein
VAPLGGAAEPAHALTPRWYKPAVSRGSLLLCAAALAALIAAPSSAHAASFNCEASALRLAAPAPLEPVTANAGASSCAPAESGGALPATPLPLTGGAVFARTTLTGSDPLSQVATATAGIGDLTVTSLLPGIPAPDLSALPGGGVLSLPGIGTVDIRPALDALVTPAGPLLQLSALKSEATARCSAGNPALAGSSSVASLKVLGTELATSAPVEKTIRALDAQTIDPSSIDVSKVLAPTADLSALQLALQPALDALPDISVPARAVQVEVTPGEELRNGDKLTRRALHISISGGGQSVLDAVAGESVVDATGVSCGSLAAAALGLGKGSSCTKRRVTLIDVLQSGNRVKLQGAADPRRFAGRRVSIVSRWDGRTVARPKVSKTGLFDATVALPPGAIRHTNRARYRAAIGGERSLDLKLERRMLVTSVRALGNRRVRVSGHITRPFGSPVQEISVTRRISCGNVRVVARLKPDSRGRFNVTLKGPKTDRVYVFRFRTKVRYDALDPRLMRTYTLPRYVLGT